MMYAPHFANVLFIIKAVNDRPRADKKYCFEEGVGTDV